MIYDLDTEVVASENTVAEYGLLPKGKYKVRLVEVGDWTPRTVNNVKVLKFDDKFQKVKDSAGADIFTLTPDVTFYETNLKFEVAEGPYTGRWLFHRLGTHPNRPWEIPNFISAIGVNTIKLSAFSSLTGRTLMASVEIDAYEKKVTDKDTGVETKVPTEFNAIKRFAKDASVVEVTGEDIV